MLFRPHFLIDCLFNTFKLLIGVRSLAGVPFTPLKLVIRAHGQKVLLLDECNHLLTQRIVYKFQLALRQLGYLLALDAFYLVLALHLVGELYVHVGDAHLAKFVLALELHEGALVLLAFQAHQVLLGLVDQLVLVIRKHDRSFTMFVVSWF